MYELDQILHDIIIAYYRAFMYFQSFLQFTAGKVELVPI